MIITKKTLPRRTFLRGLRTALALPLLDAMVPALAPVAKTAAQPTVRLGFVYIPNGALMSNWTPATNGTDFELPTTLAPLAPYRERVLVPTGLALKQAESLGDGAGDHSRASSGWLSGVHAKRTEGADIRAGVTADQVAAKEFGHLTPLPSLELAIEAYDLVGHCDVGYSCAYMNTISWSTPTTPLPMERNPRVVFDQLFGEGDNAEARAAMLREDRSILDSVLDEANTLLGTLGGSDKRRVTEYLDTVREIEQRIQRAERGQADLDLDVPPRPVGVPATFDEHVKLMFDLQVLAYAADITRVSTFLMAKEASGLAYPTLGVADGHHSLSHHQNNPDKLQKLATVNAYHMQLFAYFLDKLASTTDGDGTLLDHSMVVYGSGISEGNSHSHDPLPLVLAGGGAGTIKGGRHIQFAKDTPMASLLITLLAKMGVPVEKLGDSNGMLAI